jgi:murein DD-endopeptidase MepM/ murein hydrolase activator NlpD
MKRNKFINSSSNAKFLSASQPVKSSKQRHLLLLSILTFIGIFVTSIVLAMSKPSDNKGLTKQVVDLPNLPAQAQKVSTNVLTLPSVQKKPTQASVTATPTFENIEASQDLALMEQHAVEQLTLQKKPEKVTDEKREDTLLVWHEEKVKSGDNLSIIFSRVGLSAQDVYKVTKSDGDIKRLLNLKPGQVISFGTTSIDGQKSLQQLELKISEIEKLVITLNEGNYTAQTETRTVEVREQHATGQIESSLFGAGLTAGLSDKLIMELAYIFGWDIDFALDLRQGDTFKLIYEEAFVDGKKLKDGEILAAEFTNRGKTFKAIRYTDGKGNSHYFAPNGDSMRKAFNRTPVHFSRISSKFNPNRLHPVLKTSRPHRGVDYAAARGTPIMATGDGKVSFIGTKGGYGRTVVLSHGGKYTTLYAHMSRFKKGLKRGHSVKQGQVIGYIGSSGLATGPHLHYEFRVNGVHRNPLTVALPHAKPLADKYMADFKGKSSALLAQLNSLNDINIVYND